MYKIGVLLILLLMLGIQNVLAIEITEPTEDAKFEIGTTIRIIVKPQPGENWNAVYFGFDALTYDAIQNVFTRELTIKNNMKIGYSTLKVLAIKNGQETELTRRVEIVLPTNVKLTSIDVYPSSVFLTKLPQGSDPKRIIALETENLSIAGVYSDGVRREISSSPPDTTYVCSNESVVTVDSNGKLTAQGVGTANITVKVGDLKALIRVNVKAKNR